MFCPHCGAENEEGNRFCVNCGSELSSARESSEAASESGKGGRRDRLTELLGTTRTARLVTAATVVALVIAVVAFVSLDGDGDATADDPYLQGVDQACVAEKERIVVLEREALSQQSKGLQEFASVLVVALAEWRANLRQNPPPPEHAQEMRAFESSLLATLIEAGKLSRSIREQDSPREISQQAKVVDETTSQVDAVIEEIGLSECADLQVSPVGETQP